MSFATSKATRNVSFQLAQRRLPYQRAQLIIATGITLAGMLVACYQPGIDTDKLGKTIGDVVGSKIASESATTNAKLDGLGTLIASSSAANKPLSAAELTTALTAALKPATPAASDSTGTTTTTTGTTAHKVEIDGMEVRKIDGATIQLAFTLAQTSPKTWDALEIGADYGNGLVATMSVDQITGLRYYLPSKAVGAGAFKITSALAIRSRARRR